MHTDDELSKAIVELYNDYKDIVKKMKTNDKSYIYKIAKVNNDEKNNNYSKEEVIFIGINALIMLENDIKNNNI